MLPPLKRHLLCLALALSAGPLSAQTAAAGASAPTQAQRTTVEQDNLWDIAGQLAPAAGATRQQFMVAVLRRNPDAFVKGNIHRLRKGVPLALPDRAEVLAEDRAGSVTLVADHLKAMKAGTVLAPLAAHGPVPSVPVPSPVPAPAQVPVPVPVPAAPVTPPVPPSAPASAQAPAVKPVPPPASAATKPEPKPVPASSPASASEQETAASAPAAEVASAVTEGSSAGSASRFIPLLLVLGGVAGAVILWRRRRAGFQPDAPTPDFSPSLSATRSPGPRVFDISNAAAEMARSVETSQVVTQLVRTNEMAAPDESGLGLDLTAQAAIKLEVARASLEVGRQDDARALLQAVIREGSGRHQAEAAEILSRMG